MRVRVCVFTSAHVHVLTRQEASLRGCSSGAFEVEPLAGPGDLRYTVLAGQGARGIPLPPFPQCWGPTGTPLCLIFFTCLLESELRAPCVAVHRALSQLSIFPGPPDRF